MYLEEECHLPSYDCFSDFIGCRKERAQANDRNLVPIVEHYLSLVDLCIRSHFWFVRVLEVELIKQFGVMGLETIVE